MADACERRPAWTASVRAGAAPVVPIAPAPAPASAVAFGLVRNGWRALAWYLRELMGDNAYRVYLEHHHRHHGPDHPPLTEREFWRQRMDEQDRNPGARCC